MALWEYKIITSGKGGFASPTLLETYLNQLGKDEWEIIQFHTHPDNPLAFNGMVRRPTQREWTLEAAVAAAAKAEADKLRAELIQQQHSGRIDPAAGGDADATDAAAEPVEKPLAAEGIRKVRDTERDNDPEALAAEEQGIAGGDWDDFDEFDDDLPTFFDAIKPHQRKNPKGPGSAVGVDFLAKRWEQTEADIVGALRECGFTIPESEDEEPAYLEFEGDLYWINRNNRGALFINTREKPRPVFRVVKARELAADDPAAVELAAEHAAETAERKRRAEEQAAREAEAAARRAEQEARRQEEAARRAQEQAEREAKAAELAAGPLPEGEELLAAIGPFMRRNRRGPGHSGSLGFLAKALQRTEEELLAGLNGAGLITPENPGDKPAFTEIGDNVYWLNKDGRGGIWINGREKREPRETPSSDSAETAPSADAPSASAEQAAADTPETFAVPASETAPADTTSADTTANNDNVAADDAPAARKSADSAEKAKPAAAKKSGGTRTRSRRGPAKKKSAPKDESPEAPSAD